MLKFVTSTCLQPDCLQFACVLAPAFWLWRPQNKVGRTAVVRNAFTGGNHPDKHIGNAVLRLQFHFKAVIASYIAFYCIILLLAEQFFNKAA